MADPFGVCPNLFRNFGKLDAQQVADSSYRPITDATLEPAIDADVNLPPESNVKGFHPGCHLVHSHAFTAHRTRLGRLDLEREPIIELVESMFENYNAENRPPPVHHQPDRCDLTRLDSNDRDQRLQFSHQ